MIAQRAAEVVKPGWLRAAAATVMRAWIRSGLPGSTGGPTRLAQHVPLLRSLPVSVNGAYIYVDLRDGLSHRLLSGSPWPEPPWEQDEQIIMRRVVRPGEIAFDIGAHVGLHTVLLVALVGPEGAVHAFEINPRKLPALGRTLGAIPNATLHAFGLADRVMPVTLFVPEDQTMASLADWTHGRVGPVAQLEGSVQTLDALVDRGVLPQPDFIKCDVEGAETLIFRGAARVLDRRAAPIVLYEADVRSAEAFDHDVAEATRVLSGYRHAAYAFYWVRPGALLEPIALPGGRCKHFNLLAVPASRRDRLAAFGLTE